MNRFLGLTCVILGVVASIATPPADAQQGRRTAPARPGPPQSVMLVEIDNVLRFVDEHGVAVARVPEVVGRVCKAALSPDGRRIALSPCDDPTKLLLADRSLNISVNVDLGARAGKAARTLSWFDRDTVMYGGEVDANRIEHTLVRMQLVRGQPRHSFSRSFVGAECAFRPGATQVACIEKDDSTAAGARIVVYRASDGLRLFVHPPDRSAETAPRPRPGTPQSALGGAGMLAGRTYVAGPTWGQGGAVIYAVERTVGSSRRTLVQIRATSDRRGASFTASRFNLPAMEEDPSTILVPAPLLPGVDRVFLDGPARRYEIAAERARNAALLVGTVPSAAAPDRTSVTMPDGGFESGRVVDSYPRFDRFAP